MDKIIHLSALVACDHKRAFELFTQNPFLEHWLAPKAEVSPSIGGKYDLFWDPDDRENNSTLGCRITALEPNHFLSFEWRSPRQFKHFANQADPLSHVVVFFIPEREKTIVHLVHSGWRASPEWEEARQWQHHAWSGALKALEGWVLQGFPEGPS